jgi:hypothetical protein
LPTQSAAVLHSTQAKEGLQWGVGAVQATQAPPEPQVASALVRQTPPPQHLALGQEARQVPPLAALQQPPLQAWPLSQATLQRLAAVVPQARPGGQLTAALQPQVRFARQTWPLSLAAQPAQIPPTAPQAALSVPARQVPTV